MKARAVRSLVNSLSLLPLSLLFGGGGKSSDRGGAFQFACLPAMAIPALPLVLCCAYTLRSPPYPQLLLDSIPRERAWQMRETRTKASRLAGAILSEVDGTQEHLMQR